MTLIQKVPLGLALATCILMSSCSQENAQSVEPKDEVSAPTANPNRGVPATPLFPTTNGTLGEHYLAPGWNLVDMGLPQEPYSPFNLPGQSGTSSLTNLWGNPSIPWSKPLAQPIANASGIATFTIRKNFNGNIVTTPIVATIKNLTPGKSYSIKIYGATTFSSYCGDASMEYGRGITVEVLNAAAGTSALIDLTQKQAEWDTATLVFTAVGTEVNVKCSGFLDSQYEQSHPEFLHYLHIYADKNSIKELL